MTTNIGPRGQLVIPKAIRTSHGIQPGDDFEVLADDADFDLILLRRIRRNANAGLVDHISNCPYKGAIKRPSRRSEPMRKAPL